MATEPMPSLPAPDGSPSLEIVTEDGGQPTTVFAHSAVGSIAETATIGKHVTGRRIHFHFPGYGTSPRPRRPLNLDQLARCLHHMLTAHAATQAVSISLGTSALLRLLARHPHALRRAVLVLPFTLDQLAPPSIREHYDACLAAGRAGDAGGMLELLRTSTPDSLHHSPALARHARSLTEQRIPDLLSNVSGFVPVPDSTALARITAKSLIITHRDDPFHSVEVAESLAAAIPSARLHTVGARGALSTHRTEIAELTGDFLNRPG
ncbi:alpha/beta hydrolase [Streptomyces sp. NPDC002589]|uniref:alpha/beta fold hydrolase n=1 Tax=Streptomyces sp. NPDC002589 TaxID=3154420 RepID=UPI00332BFD26